MDVCLWVFVFVSVYVLERDREREESLCVFYLEINILRQMFQNLFAIILVGV